MEIDEQFWSEDQETFLKRLINKTIKYRVNPSSGWIFYVVLTYEYPRMTLQVQDPWRQDKPTYVVIGEKGRLFKSARSIEIVGESGLSYAAEYH